MDGLRGVAIILVILFHYVYCTFADANATAWKFVLAPIRLGFSGVDLFFILSGFLIGKILLSNKAATNYFQTFYLRRFLRIIPLYFLVLGLAAFCSLILNSGTNAELVPWWTYPFFLQNFWMAAGNTFGLASVAVTWSLAVEEQFYLTLPALVKFSSRKGLLCVSLAGIVLAPCLRFFVQEAAAGHYSLAQYLLLPCRFDDFSWGCLLALIYTAPGGPEKMAHYRSWLFAILGLSIVGLAWVAMTLKMFTLGMAVFGHTLLGIFWATVVALTLLPVEGAFLRGWRFFLMQSWLRTAGLLCFGLYLFHELFLTLAHQFVGRWGIFFTLATAIIATVSLALVSWRFLEKPIIDWSHRLSKYVKSG